MSQERCSYYPKCPVRVDDEVVEDWGDYILCNIRQQRNCEHAIYLENGASQEDLESLVREIWRIEK